jgi:amino acid adenylation domain-containing protein
VIEPDRAHDPMLTTAQRLASAAHWRKRLSALGEKTCFPHDLLADVTTPPMPATTSIRLPPSAVERLARMSRGEPAALNVILTAALVALLHRATGADAVVVGQPTVAGRPAGANTMLPLRAECPGDLTFRDLLLQLRQTVVEAVEHQNFPLATLAAELDRPAQAAENPYFDVALALDGLHDPDFARTVPTRMLWAVARDDAGIDVSVRYDMARFEAATVVFLVERYAALLERAVAEPEARLADLDLTIAADARVTARSNATGVEFDEEATIHGAFERQMRETPDAVALVGEHGSLTYAQLDARANRLARTLRARGVAPDERVGVLAERSVEMLVGILAILKAGGAYLPLDSGHPPARLRELVADSGARLVLARAGTPAPDGAELIDLDAPESYAELATPLEPTATSRDLAYVIYTSGSSGKPKGVMVEHRSVMNRIGWMQRSYPIGPDDVILQKTPISFDVSVWELFWWGFHGATLALLAPGGEKDPDAILAAAATYGVTTMHFVPSMLAAFLPYVEQFGAAERLATLRQVFSSGEELLRLQARRFAALLPHAALINLYGPTEATVDVSHHVCDPRIAEPACRSAARSTTSASTSSMLPRGRSASGCPASC